MKKGLILGLFVALLAFGAGLFLGRSGKQDLKISSSTDGASYSGGFKAQGDAASKPEGVIHSVAGPAPTNVVVVKDGESIQAAIKAAPQGTIVRVMPRSSVPFQNTCWTPAVA